MTTTTPPIQLDLIDEAIELVEKLLDVVEQAGLDRHPEFAAYHLCELVGRERWVGGPYLIDTLRELRNDIYNEKNAP